MVTLPQLLLIGVVLWLMVMAVVACTRSIKAPESLSALKQYFLLLQAKFRDRQAINPEQERAVLEVLQNRVKTSCDGSVITAHKDLRALSQSNCESIRTHMQSGPLPGQSSWLSFRELMYSFDERYFQLVG